MHSFFLVTFAILNSSFLFANTNPTPSANAKAPAFIAPKIPNWVIAARNLIGESDGRRDKSIAYLKSIKDLNKLVEKELDGEYRYHALDVVAAFNDQEFVPILQRKIFDDHDGFITLTLNTLKTDDNKNELAKYYLVILSQTDHRARLSVPSIAAMIDNLGRLGYKMPYNLFVSLLGHESPEVKESTIAYMRTLALRYKNFDYLKASEEILKNESPQFRIQTLFALAEITDYKKVDFVSACEKDKDSNVKVICKSLKNQTTRKINSDG